MLILKLDDVKLPRINSKFHKNFSVRPEYRDGKSFLTWNIKQQSEGLPLPAPPYSVTIRVSTHYDIDSFIKPLLDSMQDAKVIDNDKNITHIEIYKTAVKKNQTNSIEVYLNE